MKTYTKEDIKKSAKAHDVIFVGCAFGQAEISYKVFCAMIDKWCGREGTNDVPADKFDSHFGALFVS